MSLVNWSPRAVSLGTAALALVVFAACSGNGNPGAVPQVGSAEIKVMLPQELAVTDVAQVRVEVRGPSIPTPISADLTLQGGTWQGTIVDIPAGLDRVFEAKAFDGSSTLLYQGQAGPITISSGGTASVAILLQDVNRPPPFDNVAPTIDSLVVSSNQVSPGGTLTLTATAHDDNAGDTITYAWTSSAGTFSAPNAPATNWVAPATEGVQVLRLEVKDSKGTSATMTVDISVQRNGATGNAAVTVGFNTWPRVTAMMAVPSVLTLNSASQLAAVVSDPDGDTLDFSWGSDCPGMFTEPTSATPSFTALAPPPQPMGNRCTLSVFVTDGRGGSHSGTLSLLIGPAPHANVAPQVDSTFKSSEQAGGGEIVTVGLTAHDPESTALTFTWASNQGVILATRGTSSSSEIDWKAPACLEGEAVLTASITDAGGATTRQQFSITPRTGSSCGGLAVSGIRNVTYVRADGSVSVVPVDLSSVTVGAWVPTPDGLSYNWRPGTGQINGTFLIPNVESTPFLLQFNTGYRWVTSRTLDLSYATLGRPDVVREPDGTQLDLQLSGLANWQLDDDLQFHAPDTGLGYFSAASCAYPFFPAPLEGEMSVVGSIDYVFSLQNCGSIPGRIDPARGDVFYATQMVARTEQAGAVLFQELRRSFQTNTLGGSPSGGPLLLNGTMTELPTTMRTVDYPASSFEALALAAHPTATLINNYVNLGTLPKYDQFGTYAGFPDLAYVNAPSGIGTFQPTFTYGNPYPSQWPLIVTAQTSARVSYTAEKADGTPATPRSFTVYTYVQEPLSSGPPTPLLPRVGPPRDLRLNGAVATGTLTGVGAQPLLSWTAPSVGTPDYYSLRLYELFATSSGVTSRLQLTTLNTTQTQLRFPPGVLTPGKSYYVQVTAISQPGMDPNKPSMIMPVYHTAMAVTGRFKP